MRGVHALGTWNKLAAVQRACALQRSRLPWAGARGAIGLAGIGITVGDVLLPPADDVPKIGVAECVAVVSFSVYHALLDCVWLGAQ